MRGVAQLLGTLGIVAAVEVVDHDDALRGDARELPRSGGDVGEMVRGDSRDGELEARVGEGQLLGEADHVWLHPRRRDRSSRPRARPRATAARHARRRSRRRSQSRSPRPTRRSDRDPGPSCAPSSSGRARRGHSTDRSSAPPPFVRSPNPVDNPLWTNPHRRFQTCPNGGKKPATTRQQTTPNRCRPAAAEGRKAGSGTASKR